MDPLKDLKTIMDTELEDIKVTKRLKKETLAKIFPQKKVSWFAYSHNRRKLMGALTVFIIVLTFAIFHQAPQDNPDTPNSPKIRNNRINQPTSNRTYNVPNLGNDGARKVKSLSVY